MKLNGIRCLILFVVLSSSCFSRDYWNGTKEGMSKDSLMKLYGKRLKPYSTRGPAYPLKPYPDASAYTTDSPETFCGGNFQPFFYFDEFKPKQGLLAVELQLEKGANANGSVGDCVLKQYTARYGPPQEKRGSGRTRDIRIFWSTNSPVYFSRTSYDLVPGSRLSWVAIRLPHPRLSVPTGEISTGAERPPTG
jgi:hypothetical protein